MKKKIGLVFGLILISSLFVAYAFYTFDNLSKIKQRDVITKGIVVNFRETPKKTYIQIEFFSSDISKTKYLIERVGVLGLFHRNLKVGDSVEVIYNKENPEHGTLNYFEHTHLDWLGFILLSSIFLIIIYSLLKQIKETFNMTEAQRVQVERQEELDKEMREFIKQELIKAEEKQFLTKSNIVRILLFGLFFPLMLYRLVHSISDFILFYLAGILIDTLLIWIYYSTKKQ